MHFGDLISTIAAVLVKQNLRRYLRLLLLIMILVLVLPGEIRKRNMFETTKRGGFSASQLWIVIFSFVLLFTNLFQCRFKSNFLMGFWSLRCTFAITTLICRCNYTMRFWHNVSSNLLNTQICVFLRDNISNLIGIRLDCTQRNIDSLRLWFSRHITSIEITFFVNSFSLLYDILRHIFLILLFPIMTILCILLLFLFFFLFLFYLAITIVVATLIKAFIFNVI